jgi:hypothetical protein
LEIMVTGKINGTNASAICSSGTTRPMNTPIQVTA